MSYEIAGENKVPCHTLAVRLGSGPYVHCDTSGRTSSLKTVRQLWGFQEKPHFLLIACLFSDS